MITAIQKQKLTALADALVDQSAARILVEPLERGTGFWFGGGNVVRDPADGSVLLCGRYRSYGDSRTGLGAGERGLETAVFRAPSPRDPFAKVLSFSKADLSRGAHQVVSIEGVALHFTPDGVEYFVSAERNAPYPERVASFQKPGAGVWSIDRLSADRLENLSPDSLKEVVPCDTGDITRLHCKDPWVYDLPGGDLALGYCTHPYTWASSNTSLRRRRAGSSDYELVTAQLLHRGNAWDIAAARVTERLAVPKTGVFAGGPDVSLYFYDSCESLRQLDENPKAVSRPRGWSCEEIGGIAVGCDSDPGRLESLSTEAPQFHSPYGTGCSRYVATLATEEGIFATWQQSQDDLSQPLVGHFLPRERVEEILG